MNFYVVDEIKESGEFLFPWQFLARIAGKSHFSLDTETTGLKPFQGDKAFCFIISDGVDSYYFTKYFPPLVEMFKCKSITWYMWNAKFDLHHMKNTYGVEIAGKIWDGEIGARLEYNSHMKYSLDAATKRSGLEKFDTVKAYCDEHKLYTKVQVPGRQKENKNYHFDQVPEPLMFEYACQDALITWKECDRQRKSLAAMDALFPEKMNVPKVMSVMETEMACTPATARMEAKGVKIDIPFVERALAHQNLILGNAIDQFQRITAKKFINSDKLFAEVFADEKDKWLYTEKGNPSFPYEAIKQFTSPAAQEVIKYRDAKSRADFFSGFLFFADREGFVHPNFNQARTKTGRYSSSEPNFQNLSNDEENEEVEMDAVVRRALIPPSPDYFWCSIDYDQQEYKLMLDYAGEMGLIEEVKNGMDVHQATANLMGVSRKAAKAINFGLLYGQGAPKLAKKLGISVAEARKLIDLYFSRLPKVKQFIRTVIETAERRGYVFNWAGRRLFFDRKFSYRAPNGVIQSGGADIMKRTIPLVDALLMGKKSYMALTVHDELDLCIHKDEAHLVAEIKKIMETVYPAKYLPLTCSVSYSWDSLADLKDNLEERAA